MTDEQKEKLAGVVAETVVQHIVGVAGSLGPRNDAQDILVEVLRKLLAVSRDADKLEPSPAQEGDTAEGDRS